MSSNPGISVSSTSSPVRAKILRKSKSEQQVNQTINKKPIKKMYKYYSQQNQQEKLLYQVNVILNHLTSVSEICLLQEK